MLLQCKYVYAKLDEVNGVGNQIRHNDVNVQRSTQLSYYGSTKLCYYLQCSNNVKKLESYYWKYVSYQNF